MKIKTEAGSNTKAIPKERKYRRKKTDDEIFPVENITKSIIEDRRNIPKGFPPIVRKPLPLFLKEIKR